MATAVTTTVWVISGVHNYTTNTRTETHATLAASRTDFDVLVLLVADNTNTGHTL